MAKKRVAISIDGDIWDKAGRMYPHQRSQMVEDFFSELIETDGRDNVAKAIILLQSTLKGGEVT